MKNMKKLIIHARVVSPSAGHFGGLSSVLIGEEGLIESIDPIAEGGLEAALSEGAEIIDARGLYLFPGFIDLHAHYREPGFTDKETIYTGSRASAKGGYTTVVCMPNTKPALDSPETLLELKKIIERDAVISVLPCGAITKGIAGKELCNHASLVEAGAVAISDDGRTTMNPEFMKEAYRSSERLGIPVMTHSEDHDITSKLGGASSPPEAEDNIVKRDIELLADKDGRQVGRLHVCHVSTAESARLIAMGKARGFRVTGEATPHHIALDKENTDVTVPMSKVNPPIRSREDRMAIIEALMSGGLDCISTDHAPHELASKACEFNKATMGISGTETSFSVVHTELVRNQGMPLERLIELMCENPAKILGLTHHGVIAPGNFADLAIVDLDEEYVIDASKFVSKGHNTPFDGRSVVGRVKMTLKGGNIVFDELDKRVEKTCD